MTVDDLETINGMVARWFRAKHRQNQRLADEIEATLLNEQGVELPQEQEAA